MQETTQEKRIITVEEIKAKMPERFWKKIKFGQPDECWVWQRGKTRDGYGQFHVRINGEDRILKASRLLYSVVFSESFNSELLVLHNCPNGDNPACCNPAHLWQGTDWDNVHDMMKKGRHKPSIGSKHGCAILDETNVIEIKKRLSTGEPQWKIAESFNVSKTVISRIKLGINWKHVISDAVMPNLKYNQKITREMAIEIKIRLSNGEACNIIAKDYDVHACQIQRINRGEKWADVKI